MSSIKNDFAIFDQIAAETDRVRAELAIVKAALNLARERAEDAEADSAEVKKELAKELGEETERANELEIENQELSAKIDQLENAAAIEGHKLSAAYGHLRTLRMNYAAQSQRIDALENADTARHGKARIIPRTKPGIHAFEGPDPSDADPHLANPVPAQLPAVAAIAAELVDAMAANEAAPATAPVNNRSRRPAVNPIPAPRQLVPGYAFHVV
jgi:hypothetical protein